MPPFLKRKCPDCGYLNHYDQAQLQKENAVIYRDPLDNPGPSPQREYQVICGGCRRPFVIIVKEKP